MNTPEFGVRLTDEAIHELRRHGHPVLEDSTIMHCTKSFLLDYIRCLENSYAGALWAMIIRQDY